jgi:hypothetical protein
MYDIFYISSGVVDVDSWSKFKLRFPTSQKLENIKSFEDVKKHSFTKLFWVVWDNLVLTEDFNLDYKVSKWDESYVHVFKNGNFYDGVCIFSKSSKIMQREWVYRFFTNKKEIDQVASNPKKYDIIFISYYEPSADQNYKSLVDKVKDNTVLSINGIKGIHNAHVEAAKLASTDMFYVVDADAVLMEDFNFDYHIPYYDFNAKNSVHVWRSRNPINDLEYGYGGVKLLPREKTMNMDLSKPDMTTSISSKFKPILSVSNITAFNTDEFNTWRSAFRECCKLSSKVIDRQKDDETNSRLLIWCTVGADRPFGKYAIAGAIAGKLYGEENSKNIEALKKINDFEWLKEQYASRHPKD